MGHKEQTKKSGRTADDRHRLDLKYGHTKCEFGLPNAASRIYGRLKSDKVGLNLGLAIRLTGWVELDRYRALEGWPTELNPI